MVTNVELSNPADAREPDHAYLLNFGIRLFKPTAWASLACPMADKLWHFSSKALDFRAAQHEFAMIPRDGPWFSNWEVTLHGNVSLTSPQQGNSLGLPEELFVTVRISWSPAHVTIRFTDEGVLQKITFRPWFGSPAFWTQGTYDWKAFTRKMKLATPLMFYIPSEVPADAAKTKYAVATPANDSKTVTGPASDSKKAPVTASDSKPAPETKNDKEPAKETEPAPEVTNESKPNDEQPSESEFEPEERYNDWNDWSDWQDCNYDWNAWNSQNDWHDSSDEESKTPPDEPKLADSKSESPPSPKVAPSSVEPASHREASPKTAQPVPEVTNQSAVKNKSLFFAESHEPQNAIDLSSASSFLSLSTYQENFQALQRMADAGPPFTLEERYARQELANRLYLSPLIYNMMVFGEVPTAPAAPK